MNLYGWSKHMFDLAVIERVRRKEPVPPQWAGLKFFNVFGANEYHKGEMMSLVAKRFDDAKAGKAIRLFKSHRAGIADGEQKRDFIYVDDTVAVVRWLLATPTVSGIFNVGTGKARSFRDLIGAMFAALGREPAIEYIDMPAEIRDSYQYFTQAETGNLRRAGYNARVHAARRRGAALRDDLSRSRRPLSVSRSFAGMFDFEEALKLVGQAERALRRRSHARRFRLWRRHAHFARGADARCWRCATARSRSAAPAMWRATSRRWARSASSSALIGNDDAGLTLTDALGKFNGRDRARSRHR